MSETIMQIDARRRHELGWLEVIKTYLSHQLIHPHLFRTAVDNWSMYRRGEIFLTKSGLPKFFNKPISTDPRLQLMDFISVNAQGVIDGPARVGELIVDHAVPVSVLHSLVRERPIKTILEIEEFLISYYRLGVLTVDEDRHLARSKMPAAWSGDANRDPFARYSGIARYVA